MRQRALIGVVWLVAAVVVGSSALFAASAQDVGPTFETRCGRCHNVGDLARQLAQRPADTRAPFLAQMLGNHFAPPEAERAALAAFVLANIPR